LQIKRSPAFTPDGTVREMSFMPGGSYCPPPARPVIADISQILVHQIFACFRPQFLQSLSSDIIFSLKISWYFARLFHFHVFQLSEFSFFFD